MARYNTEIFLLILLSTFFAVALNEDFIDTENEIDDEAGLKCDACTIVSVKVSLLSIFFWLLKK